MKNYIAYITDSKILEDDGVFDVCLGRVSEYRRNKVLKLRRREDRNSSLAAGVLLTYVLDIWGGIDERRVEYECNKKGKPFIKNYFGDVCFSMSHTEGCAAVVLCKKPCGIDVERIRRIPDSIVDRLFSDMDRNVISEDQQNADVYGMSVWTRREAYSKMTGTGILMKDESQKMVMNDEYMNGKGVSLKNAVFDIGGSEFMTALALSDQIDEYKGVEFIPSDQIIRELFGK